MPKIRAMHAKKSIGDAASGLQDLVDSAEDLLTDLKDQKGEAVERLREKVSTTISDARQRLADSDVSDIASEAYDNAVGLVRQDPWRAVAIGALALLAGSLLLRALSDD
jgi:ElaB/YqjD/DUF883 family membrane-anchored ribosome-binding protein